MSKATINIEGYLSRDPELAFTQGGDAYLPLSVPHTPRKLNKDTQQWEDAGDTLWVQATLWREAAEQYAPLLRKGTMVRIEGEPVMRAWSSGEKSGVNLEVKFARVSMFPKKPEAGTGGQWQGGAQAGQGGPQTPNAGAGDTWPTATPQAGSDGFGGAGYDEPF